MLVGSSSDRPSKPDALLDPRLLARLERVDIRSTKMFPGKLQGERRSKKRGQSVEFDDYRNYTPGDDLRFVDWNVYARLDRLFIKLFLEEEDLALHLIVDASASMHAGSPSKALAAARIALALGYIGLVNNNRVTVSLFGAPGAEQLVRLPDMRGRRHTRRLTEFLLNNIWTEPSGTQTPTGQAGPRATFDAALSTIARMRVGKGVMILISDMLIPDGYETGLSSLAAASGSISSKGAGGYDIHCLQILSPEELDPARLLESGFTGDVRLTDVETTHAAEITLAPDLVRAYKKRLEAYTTALNTFCTARGISHMVMQTDQSIEHLVLGSLQRAGIVG
jgi:hypothetical protein